MVRPLLVAIFIVSTDRPYASARWSTGLARSRDLRRWKKSAVNPVLPIRRGFGNDGPEMVILDGRVYLYVRSSGSTTRYILRGD